MRVLFHLVHHTSALGWMEYVAAKYGILELDLAIMFTEHADKEMKGID